MRLSALTIKPFFFLQPFFGGPCWSNDRMQLFLAIPHGPQVAHVQSRHPGIFFLSRFVQVCHVQFQCFMLNFFLDFSVLFCTFLLPLVSDPDFLPLLWFSPSEAPCQPAPDCSGVIAFNGLCASPGIFPRHTIFPHDLYFVNCVYSCSFKSSFKLGRNGSLFSWFWDNRFFPLKMWQTYFYFLSSHSEAETTK